MTSDPIFSLHCHLMFQLVQWEKSDVSGDSAVWNLLETCQALLQSLEYVCHANHSQGDTAKVFSLVISQSQRFKILSTFTALILIIIPDNDCEPEDLFYMLHRLALPMSVHRIVLMDHFLRWFLSDELCTLFTSIKLKLGTLMEPLVQILHSVIIRGPKKIQLLS